MSPLQVFVAATVATGAVVTWFAALARTFNMENMYELTTLQRVGWAATLSLATGVLASLCAWMRGAA